MECSNDFDKTTQLFLMIKSRIAILFVSYLLLNNLSAQFDPIKFSVGFKANNKAKKHIAEGNYRMAIAEAKIGKHTFRELGWGDGYLLANGMLTSCHVRLLQLDSAFLTAREGIDALRKYPVGDITRATAYYTMAHAFQIFGQVDSSLYYSNQMLPILERGKTLMDTTGLPDIYKLMILAGVSKPFFEDAKNALKAQAFHQIGATYLGTYDYGQAEKYFQLSGDYFQKSGEKLDESGAWFSLGMIYFSRYKFQVFGKEETNFERAANYLKKAVKMAAQTGDKNMALVGYYYMYLGILYHLNEQYNAGQEYLAQGKDLISKYDQAIIARKVGLDAKLVALQIELEDLFYVSEAGRSRFTVEHRSRLEQLEIQLKQFNQKLFYREKHIASLQLSKLAQIQTNLGNWEKAFSLFEKAFTAINPGASLRDHDLESLIRRKPSKGVDLDINIFFQAARMFELQTEAKSDEGLLDSAQKYYQLAGVALEQNRPQYFHQSGLSSIGETGHLSLNYYADKIYNALIRVALYKNSKPGIEEIFTYVEKSRAIISRNRINFNRLLAKLPDSLSAKYRELYADLNATWTELRGADTEDPFIYDPAVDHKILSLQKELDDLINKEIYPRFIAPLNSSPDESFPIEAIQQNVLGDSSILIAHIIDDENKVMYIPWIGDARTKNGVLEIDLPDKFWELVSDYRFFIESPKAYESSDAIARYLLASEQLFNLLLKPVLDQNAQALKHTIVIPDPRLGQLSLDALLVVEDSLGVSADRLYNNQNYSVLPFLLDTMSISYGYSAWTLYELSKLPKYSLNSPNYLDYGGLEPHYERRTVSDFDIDKDQEIIDYFKKHKQLLSFYPSLVDKAQQVLVRAKTKTWQGEEVSEAGFRQIVGESSFNIFHLSAHGFVNQRYPFESKILLTKTADPDIRAVGPGVKARTFDDNITITELFSMQIQANLAILTSCYSAGGRFQFGEGIASISRGFSFAGCPAVIAGLWSLRVGPTSTILVDSIDEIYAGTAPAEALRKAKLGYIEKISRDNESTFFTAPHFWAGSVLWGANSVLFQK